ncbi:MAG: type II toxin-antitoxin system VapC family toxin [Spirochaetes bacterium]|nr:type II toxin-antitoxin system VapC family toxin [Spirochaetota bacterium]
MIVLDTHVWLFWVNDDRELISKKALTAINRAESLGVSVISCWEIAMLVVKQRLAFNMDVQDWVNQASKYPRIRLIGLDAEVAVLSTRLPGNFHGDPADRMIVATCMKHNVPLISKDKMIRSWGQIKVIW